MINHTKPPRKIKAVRVIACHSKNPRRVVTQRQPPGWGDYFAIALSKGYVVPFVKISKKRYRRWKIKWGFSDACNCDERKQKLNRFGRWVSKPLRKSYARIHAAIRKLAVYLS